MSKLTDKKEQFCQEFLVDLNATQAAIRAGYSKKTARQQASQLLAQKPVIDRVRALRDARAKRLSLDQDTVLRELAKLALFNPEDFVERDEDGNFLRVSLDNLSRDQMAAVASIDHQRTVLAGKAKEAHGGSDGDTIFEETLRIRFTNKMQAVKAAGEHLGLFEKAKQDGVADLLAILQGNKPLTSDALEP